MDKFEEYVTNSDSETRDLGKKFCERLIAGDTVSLIGPLGAGKTTFSQGVAEGLGIESRIISPTFVLMRQHTGKRDGREITLYHIDLYRLDSEKDIESLGITEVLHDENGIFLIEWAEKYPKINPKFTINFEIKNDNHTIKINTHE